MTLREDSPKGGGINISPAMITAVIQILALAMLFGGFYYSMKDIPRDVIAIRDTLTRVDTSLSINIERINQRLDIIDKRLDVLDTKVDVHTAKD